MKNYSQYNKNSLKKNESILKKACIDGDLLIVKYLLESSDVINKPMPVRFNKKSNADDVFLEYFGFSIQSGNLNLVFYLGENVYKKYISKIDYISYACIQEQTDLISYFVDKFPPFTSNEFDELYSFIKYSIYENKLSIFKSLIDSNVKKGIPFEKLINDNAFQSIIQNDLVDFFKYLYVESNHNLTNMNLLFLNGANYTKTIYDNYLDIIDTKNNYDILNMKLDNKSNTKKLKI